MQRIILTEQPEKYTVGFDNVDIVDVAPLVGEVPANWKLYGQEFGPYIICESLQRVDSFVAIDFGITCVNQYLLAHHVLSTLKDPVVVLVADENIPNLQLAKDFGLLRNEGIAVIRIEQLSELFTAQELLEKYVEQFHDTFDPNRYFKESPAFFKMDRHQMINEWGAIKLLLNHGLTLQQIEAAYPLPKTVFFKQKLASLNIGETSVLSLSSYPELSKLQQAKGNFLSAAAAVRKILLIDDNADKGWQFALQQLFSSAQIDVCACYQDACAITNFAQYDLIFLDLRLPDVFGGSYPDIENGKSLIRDIKAKPNARYIPLIVFTASQQARTMHEVLNGGADAMYVKEAPDWDSQQSVQNYHEFLDMLQLQIKKGAELKIYWQAIVQIKSNFLSQIANQPGFAFEDRIEERLEMFYGLLKKKYEELEYNKTMFHFSADILAFITLWSILNDIQEAYFEKGLGESFTKVKNFSTTPPSYTPVPLDNWRIKGQTPDKYFVVEKPIIEENITVTGSRSRPGLDYIRRDIYSDFQINRTSPYFGFDPAGFQFRKVDYRTKLFVQIGFLLMAKNELIGTTKQAGYLQTLRDANEQRNKLYLTHGEDGSNFYAVKEKDKHFSSAITLDLFKLVAFLLTGNDTII